MNRQSILTCQSAAERARLDKAEADCRRQGAAFTSIRRLVFMLLQRHPQGIKAYDLLDLIRTLKPNAAPPTVYRALNFLVAHGLAHKINCINLFIACNQDSQKPDESTLFLVCPRCHSVTEFQDNTASQALRQALVATGYQLSHRVMEIGAVCPLCSAQEQHHHKHGNNLPRPATSQSAAEPVKTPEAT